MKTILQVEDDANDVFFLQRALTKAGVPNPIQVAIDGQQAIDYLQGVGKFADREHFPLPCLVLLDLKLPRVMGLEVLKWIRQQPGTAVPVIILSASAENADMATAYSLGANAFVTKPSEAAKLEDMAKAIKDFWLTYNTLPEESYGAPAAAPAYSDTIAESANHLPATIGARRDGWLPMMSKQTYDKKNSLGL